MFPSHSEFLADSPVVLLGAGSSVSFGFPAWSGLRALLIERVGDFLDGPKQPLADAAKEFHAWLKKPDDRTVDKFVFDKDNPEITFLFSSLIDEDFQEKENDYRNYPRRNSWIYWFCEYFLRCILHQLEEKNFEIGKDWQILNVVSLNYERVFLFHLTEVYDLENRIMRYLNKRDKDRWPHPIASSFAREIVVSTIRVFHPHGSLGLLDADLSEDNTVLNQNSGYPRKFGDEMSFVDGKSLIPVGHGNPEHNPTYRRVNDALGTTSRIYCLGVGYEGIKSAHLVPQIGSRVRYSLFDDKLWHGLLPGCFPEPHEGRLEELLT